MHMGRHLVQFSAKLAVLHQQSEDQLGFPEVPTRTCSKWSHFSLVGLLALDEKAVVRLGNALNTATQSQKTLTFGDKVQHNFTLCIPQYSGDESLSCAKCLHELKFCSPFSYALCLCNHRLIQNAL